MCQRNQFMDWPHFVEDFTQVRREAARIRATALSTRLRSLFNILKKQLGQCQNPRSISKKKDNVKILRDEFSSGINPVLDQKRQLWQ